MVKSFLMVMCLAVALSVAAFMPSPEAEEQKLQPMVMVSRVLEPGETIRTVAAAEYPNQSAYKSLGQWVAVVIKTNGGHENFKPGDRVLLPMSLRK